VNIPVKNTLSETLNVFFRALLEKNIVEALAVPQALFDGKTFSLTLVKDPEKITHAQPFLPVLMNNGAEALASLTATGISGKVGAVMRSCEIRATVELAKFNQVKLENILFIGVDCLGTMENEDFVRYITDKGFAPEAYLKGLLEGRESIPVRQACRVCPYPVPAHAEIRLGFIGTDPEKYLTVEASEELTAALGLVGVASNVERENAVSLIVKARTEARDRFLKDMKDRFKSIDEMLAEFARCKRCYNCRTQCPICFCNECIFLTKVFDHESADYLRWAKRKGALRLPYDTLLFHLTRLNHMATSCVGCGQCSSACPNGLPVFELFQYVGEEVQKLFEYVPGARVEDTPPISTFREKELEAL